MSDELDEIRKKRLKELQSNEKYEEDLQKQKELEEFERQKQLILRSILTDEAKQRLSNIKLVKPQLAVSIENQLIQISQSGRMRGGKINEAQLLQLLRQIQGSKRESKIEFKRR